MPASPELRKLFMTRSSTGKRKATSWIINCSGDVFDNLISAPEGDISTNWWYTSATTFLVQEYGYRVVCPVVMKRFRVRKKARLAEQRRQRYHAKKLLQTTTQTGEQ